MSDDDDDASAAVRSRIAAELNMLYVISRWIKYFCEEEIWKFCEFLLISVFLNI